MPRNRELSEQEIFIASRAMSAEIDAVQTRLASEKKISRSEVIRRLVRAGLDHLKDEQMEPKMT